MENKLVDWIKSGEDPWMDLGNATEYLMSMHPRGIFVKSLPRHASLLDMGAGDGSLQVLKKWPNPVRSDLKMYAYSMEFADAFEHYDKYELGEWPFKKPEFDELLFDAIFSAHFIEHISSPLEYIDWSKSRLKIGGRLYIEWPSNGSIGLPPISVFKDQNIPLTISEFYDDHTHKDLPDKTKILNHLGSCNFSIDQQGTISNPFLEEEIIAHFKHGNLDAYALQAAYWSKTKWSQFIIATKVI